MQLHTETLGYVSFAIPADAYAQADAMHETNEFNMLRCRYAAKQAVPSYSALCGFLPSTHEIIHNPNTLKGLADIFHTTIEIAFSA